MRGGPIDLTPFGAVLTSIGWLYWLLAAGGLWWALRGAHTRKVKLFRALPIVLLFGFGPVTSMVAGFGANHKLNAAMAIFEAHCKTAGEKITRTVDNVEGIVWMKWRPDDVRQSDQFALTDPYGRDCGGEACIASLLRVIEGAALNPDEAKRHAVGYRFVETVDPRDGKRYRYRGVVKLDPRWTEKAIAREKELTGKGIEMFDFRFVYERELITEFGARYGVSWGDISTHEDRNHWIAGSSLKVIDLTTNDLIANRVGYMIDRGQGSRDGSRSPWLFAADTACPAFDVSEANNSIRSSRSRDFIRRVLKPLER